jgi:hypothetical protein
VFPLEVRLHARGPHVVADVSFRHDEPSWVQCSCGARAQGRPETIAEWFRRHVTASSAGLDIAPEDGHGRGDMVERSGPTGDPDRRTEEARRGEAIPTG